MSDPKPKPEKLPSLMEQIMTAFHGYSPGGTVGVHHETGVRTALLWRHTVEARQGWEASLAALRAMPLSGGVTAVEVVDRDTYTMSFSHC